MIPKNPFPDSAFMLSHVFSVMKTFCILFVRVLYNCQSVCVC